MHPKTTIPAALLLFALCVTPRASAATLHVPADYPTIQSCIDAAISGQDECLVAPGTYHELVDFLGKAIAVRSEIGPEATTIDGTGLGGSVVTFTSNQTTEATMEGFTIAGGVGTKLNGFTRGGGIHIRGDAFHQRHIRFDVRNIIVTGNDADYGGGIYVAVEDMITLSECEITNNSARYGGGVFGSSYAQIGVQGAYFSGNTADYYGGAILGLFITLELARGEFSQNSAGPNGGAIAVMGSVLPNEFGSAIGESLPASALRNPYYVSISDCVFESNQGGAIHEGTGSSWGSFEVSRCVFRNNIASFGGAIVAASRDAQISQCVFLQNQATQDGGAVVNNGSIYSSSFQDNHAGRDGGAVFHDLYQSGPVENCSFERNSAQRGGALFGYTNAAGATFVGNRASDFGGAWHGNGAVSGVFLSNTAGEAGGAAYVTGPARVLDSLFVGNVSALGGALYNAGSASIYNGTFVANGATDSGGAISNVGGPEALSLSITNSILWHNSAVPLWVDEDLANTTIAACDIEGSGGSTSWDSSLGIDIGNNLDVDPVFTRLPDDGGDGWGDDPSTPNIDESLNDDIGDLHLLAGSPCINAGDPDLTFSPGSIDLDSHARVLCGLVDMGAYEFGIGDFDCNQAVNLADLFAWPACATDPAADQSTIGCESIDFNADGAVDLADFAQWMLVFVP